jgi:iron complex outermembrane receptor protein
MKRKTALARGGILLILFLSITTIAFSQNTFKVTGKVTDETGKPVEGATVQVKGTTIATSTSADGTYSLMAPSGTATLVITSVGYTQQEVAINSKPEVNCKNCEYSLHHYRTLSLLVTQQLKERM